jgi:chemotaxis protein MotB
MYMKMTPLLRPALYTLLLAGTLSSCVTRKKFDDLTANKVQIEAERNDFESRLAAAKTELDRYSKLTADLNTENGRLKNDTTQLGLSYRKSQSLYKDLNATYEKLLTNHNRLLSNSAAEASKLGQDLATRERELLAIERSLQETRSANQKLSEDLSVREQRVKELEKVLADKEKAVDALRAKVSGALLNFKEKDLTVNVKNGKVYVSLSEQLLFKSGSFAVDKNGIEAIKKLAQVLKESDDISVVVEGHTDDVPLNRNTVGMSDNWDLSVLRATSIIRTLTAEGVNGVKLTAAGRGENSPLDAGRTSEARQKNRRTEIILTPKLDELFQILDN